MVHYSANATTRFLLALRILRNKHKVNRRDSSRGRDFCNETRYLRVSRCGQSKAKYPEVGREGEGAW